MKIDESQIKVPSLVGIDELKTYNKAFHKTDDVLDVYKNYFTAPNDVTVKAEGSKIIEFFKSKNVFLTGGTGFVGILTVEKLLRACPHIGRIYLLIRNKKNRDVKTRMEKYFKSTCFDPLRKIYPNFQEKITALTGDMAADNLGLSDEDRKTLIKNVHIIINSAASVNFEEKFRTAVNVNVRGTVHMLELAKECKNLLVFTHISTAFSTYNPRQIKEEITDYWEDIDELLDIANKYSEEELEVMSEKYRGNFPNTYTLSKHLAENVVKRYMKELPCIVYRPSMIMATYREPLRGWTNNIYGPMGIFFTSGLGLQHVLLLDKDTSPDTVPGDYVVNGLIATIYKTAQNRANAGKVYNFVNRPSVQYCFAEYIHFLINAKYHLIPSVCKLHAYNALTTTNVNLFLFAGFFFHTIPAIFLDFILNLVGVKLPMKLTDAVKKIHKLMVKTFDYNKYNWKFEYENVDNLWREMTWADMNAFPFNVHEVNPKLHMISILGGLRVYMVKDPISTLEDARKSYWRIESAFYIFYAISAVIVFVLLNKLYNFMFL